MDIFKHLLLPVGAIWASFFSWAATAQDATRPLLVQSLTMESSQDCNLECQQTLDQYKLWVGESLTPGSNELGGQVGGETAFHGELFESARTKGINTRQLEIKRTIDSQINKSFTPFKW